MQDKDSFYHSNHSNSVMESKLRKRVSAVILKDGKILLIRRVKPDQEYFVFPGGGVDGGESLLEALSREVREELSLEVKKQKFLFSLENLVIPAMITIHKGNQDEYYFLIEEYTGVPLIGGSERARMNEQNQYYVVWLGLKEMGTVGNVFPKKGVIKLLSFLKHQKDMKGLCSVYQS